MRSTRSFLPLQFLSRILYADSCDKACEEGLRLWALKINCLLYQARSGLDHVSARCQAQVVG